MVVALLYSLANFLVTLSTRNTQEKNRKAESYEKIEKMMGRIMKILKDGEEHGGRSYGVLQGQKRGRTRCCRIANWKYKRWLIGLIAWKYIALTFYRFADRSRVNIQEFITTFILFRKEPRKSDYCDQENRKRCDIDSAVI